MKTPHSPLLNLKTFIALALGTLLVFASAAQSYRVLERDADGTVTIRIADAQEPRDGIDPVTYHELFAQSTQADHAQILWIASDTPIALDSRALLAEEVGYPMVVSASMPNGTTLVYEARSVETNELIEDFTHTAAGPEWSINQQKLATLPNGLFDIQVSIRSAQMPDTRTRQRVLIEGKKKERNGNRPGITPINPNPTLEPVEITPLIEWELPAGGRIIYVSSSTGHDSKDGRSPQNAVRSLDRGYALIRDERPDWLLLRRGDDFELADDETGDFRAWHKSGRSPLEPMIIGAYGEQSDPLPRLHSNGLGVLKYLYVDNLVIRDLHFYANQRDPRSPDFDGGTSRREFGLHMARAENVVIQGCLFEYFNTNVMLRTDEDIQDSRLRGIRFHRCVFRDSYQLNGDDSHGLYCKHVVGIAITDCVFDHNGWSEEVDDSYRTGRSHNIYFSDCTQMTLEGNIFCREAYLCVKIRCEVPGLCRDVSIRNNLFIACAFPLEFGANGDEDSINFVDIELRNNVFARTTGWPVDAPRNLAVKITRTSGALVDGNIFIDNGPNGSDRNEAIRASASHALDHIVISNNDAFLPTPDGDDMFSTHYRDRRSVSGVTFSNNHENINPNQYVDASVTLEGYLEQRDVEVRTIDKMMQLMAEGTLSNRQRLTIGGMIQYYRDGFTLVNGN